MKKKTKFATNKVTANLANSKIKEQREKIIIDQIFQEAYSQLIKDDRYKGKTIDEMKDMMMKDKEGNYRLRVERRMEGIAPILFGRSEVFEAPTEHSVIIHNTDKVWDNSLKNSKIDTIKDSLSHTRVDFFERITNGTNPINLPKQQQGDRLIKEVIREDCFNYQRITTSSRQQLHEMGAAYNFFNETKNVFAFDTETFGGQNYDGISELFTIHDISYIHGNVDTGLNEVSFIRGLTEEEGERMLKEMERIVATGDTSSKANVYRKALITYSGNIDEMTETRDGLIRMVNPVEYDAHNVYQMDDFKRGIDNLVQINKSYKRGDNGLTLYEEKIAEMVRLMNDNNHAVLTYNGTYADMPWMNSFVNDTYNSLSNKGKKEFLAQANLKQMQNINVSYNLDLMNILREANDSDLIKAIYGKRGLSTNRMHAGLTALSQEAIVTALLGDAGNAHTSLDDTRNLLKLVTELHDIAGEEQNLMNFAINKIKEKHNISDNNFNKDGFVIRPGEGDLFLATKGIGHDGTKGVMSFSYDPVADAYRTTSGFDIGKVGKDGKNKVTKQSYALNAVSKNQFYTVEDIYKLTTNDKHWGEISSQFSELNAPELYVAKVMPHYAPGVKGVNIGMEQPSYIVAQTKELLEQQISSKLARVGVYKDGNYKMAEGVEDLLKVVTLNPSGEVVKEEVDLGLAVAVRTNNVISDRTRRSVATMTHTRYEKFKEFEKVATQVFGKDYQPNQAQMLVNKLALANGEEVAIKVAKGQVVNVNPSILTDILEAKNMATRNEVDNLKHAFAFWKEIQPIAELVDKEVTAAYGNTSARNIAFENTMNNIMAVAADKFVTDSSHNVDIRKAYLNNLTSTQHMSTDLESFVFEIPGLIKEKDVWLDNPLSVSDRKQSLSFNLRGDAYGIKKTIVDSLNPDSPATGYAKAQEEIIAMTQFLRAANADKNYFGQFEHILNDKYAITDPDIMANSILETLRGLREKDPTIGVRRDILVQNIDKEHYAIKHLINSTSDLESFVKQQVSEAPRVTTIGKNTKVGSDVIDDLIDNYLIDLKIGGKKYASAEEYIKKIGYSGVEAKYFVDNVKQTQQAYRSFLTSYIQEYSKGGKVDFVYDFKKHQLIAKGVGGEIVDVTQNMPRIVGRGVNIHAQQGNMKMAFRGILNMEKFISGDTVNPNAVTIQSNIAYALNHAMEDMQYRLDDVLQKGEQMKGANYTLSNVGKYMFGGKKNRKSGISHISPTVGYSSKESLSFLGLDLRDAYSYMSEIANMEIMQNQRFSTENLIDILKESPKFNINSMPNSIARYLTRDFNPMLQVLFKENKSVYEVISMLNPAGVKHTELHKGYQMVGGTYVDPLFGNNGSRPVPFTAFLRRSVNETEAALKSLRKEGYIGSVGSPFTLSTNYKRSQIGVTGIGKVTDNVVLSKANISDIHFKARLGQFLEEEGSNLPEAVKKRLTSVNLTEQEKILDGYVADALFSKQQIQKIGLPTQLPEYSEYLDNFRDASFDILTGEDGKLQFKYKRAGKVFKSNQVIGYKDGYNGVEAMTAKYEGRLKYGFFSEGMLVGEDNITNLIQGAKTKEEALAIINETFDSSGSFYIDRVDDIGYIKLINGGVEKDMSNKMLLGVGSVDEEVGQFFKKIGRANDANNHRLYQIDELKHIIKDNYRTYAKDLKEKALSEEEILERALEERYAATNALQQMFGRTKDNRIAIFAAHEMEKHGSTMMAFSEQISTIQHNMIKNGDAQTLEEAAQKVFNKLEEYDVINNTGTRLEGSTIILPQDWNGMNEDGTLKEINLTKFREMVKKEKYSIDETLFTTGEILKMQNEKGEDIILGSVLMSSVSEADDYQGVSTAQDFNLATKELDDEIKKVKTTMNALDPEDDMRKVYMNRIEELKEQKHKINDAIKDRQRGRSYGKRDIEMLNMQRYDKSYNSVVRKAFAYEHDDGTYLRIMGKRLQVFDNDYAVDAAGEYLLKDGSSTESVLSNWTKQIKKNMTLGGPGDEILVSDKNGSIPLRKRLRQLYSDREVRNSIQTLVQKNGEMSKDYAELLYSFNKAQEAGRFNSGLIRRENKKTGAFEIVDARERSIATAEEMEKRGFRKLAIEDAIQSSDLDARAIVDDPNSIFKSNILLDLGSDLDEETRYIAMPFVANKATIGEDLADSHIIQFNFQKQMRVIQSRKDAVQELKRSFSGKPKEQKAIEEATELLRQSAEEMRRQIYVDTLGKNGVAGQLGTYKAEFSINSKTSSFVYMDENMFKHIEHSVQKEKATELAYMAKETNYHALKRAKINGVTLEQHYREGRYFNTRFMNLQSFEQMGLLDDDFIQQQLQGYDFSTYFNEKGLTAEQIEKFNKKTVKERNLEVFKHRLETEGIMVDTVRYPTIKQGSTGPSMLYLDDTLAYGVTKVGIEGQLAYTGDNDGDHVVSNLIFRRKKGADGKDIILTSMNAKDDEMFVQALGYMHYRAAGANTYWRREAENIIYKAMKTGVSNGDIDSMLKGDRLLNTHVGVDSLENINKHRDSLNEFLDAFNAANNTDYSIGDFHVKDSKLLSQFDDFLAENVSDDATRKKYLEAYGFELQHGKMFMDMHAKDNLHYTGHVNVPLYAQREIMDLRMIADASATTDEQMLLNRAFGTIEQKIISSKKMEYSDSAVENFSAIEKKVDSFTEALNKIYYNREEGKEMMTKWLQDNQDVQDGFLDNAIELMSEERFDKTLTDRFFSLEKLLAQDDLSDIERAAAREAMSRTEQEIKDVMTESVVESLAALNSDQRKDMKARFAIGVLTEYNDSINMQQFSHYLKDEGIYGSVLQMLKDAGADINVVEDYSFKSARAKAFDVEAKEVAAYAFDEDTGQASSKVLQSVKGMMSNAKPTGLGIGALAVAASVLAVGAVGGNPSQATGMEAAEAAQVGMPELDMMGPIQPQVAQTNTGYVINVRGRGNRASISRASQQITRSMNNNGYSNDVNINMNISEDSTIINDRFLEQMISDAIR